MHFIPYISLFSIIRYATIYRLLQILYIRKGSYMFVSASSTYDETYEYNRFCQIIDPIIAKGHSGQKLIVVLDNNKLTCMNSSEKTICTIKNVDGLLALDIQFHLQILKFEFTEYRGSPKYFKALYECKKKDSFSC